MNKLLLLALLLCSTGPLSGQNITGRYVSKTDEQGTVYHTFPCEIFKHPANGHLTFDITYRSNGNQVATVNFTYLMKEMTPVDSIGFVSGEHRVAGAVQKIYISPEKNEWKHRYSFAADVEIFSRFFDKSATPQVILYARGNTWVYEVKPAAWRSEAPVMEKIFEMIRINESH